MTAETQCARCGAPVQQVHAKGRKRKYCPTCRVKAAHGSPKPKRPFIRRTRKILTRILRCAGCGGLFIQKHPDARCCSKACANTLSHRTRVTNAEDRRTVTCKGCGVQFVAKALDRMQFCTRECSISRQQADAALRMARLSIVRMLSRRTECEECGLTFSRSFGGVTTCSDECRAKRLKAKRASAYMAKKPSAESRECPECKAMFEPPRTQGQHVYCSPQCSDSGKRRIAKGHRKQHRKKYGRKFRERARYHGVEYEPVNVMAVFERDRWTCQICGVKTPKKFRGTFVNQAPEIDHRVPMAMGGAHSWGNLQCACRACNLRKGGTQALGQMSLWADPRAA